MPIPIPNQTQAKQFQTSFIPKQNTMGSIKSPRRVVNFISLIALIFFIASIVLAGGVFMYKIVLNKQIEGLKEDLVKSQNAFEQDFANQVIRLETRIDTAGELLKKHIAPSEIFGMLEGKTLSSISFSSYEYSSSGEGMPSISMKGEADDFEAIANQSIHFSDRTTGIREPVFSGLTVTLDGVVFDFSAKIDPTTISYENNLSTSNASASADFFDANNTSTVEEETTSDTDEENIDNQTTQ